MSTKNLTKSLPLLATLLLVGCGGGGGGGGDDDTGLVYTGLTTPAAIDDTNAAILVEGALGGSTTGTAFGVVSNEPGVQQDPVILDVARILSGIVTQLDINPSSSTLPGAIVSESSSEPCQDGGSLELDLRIDDVTFDFNGEFEFINCAEDGTTINGPGTVVGGIGATSFVMNFSFDPVTVVSGAENSTISGTIGTSLVFPDSVTITMEILAHDNNTGIVEWFNNLVISGIDNFSFLEMTIEGRYYHPQYGYVDIFTNLAFQINVADQWPYFGQMTIIGDRGSRARLTALSNTQYTLDVDADGDGTYESSTIEDWG